MSYAVIRPVATASLVAVLAFTTACGIDGGQLSACVDAGKALTEFGAKVTELGNDPPKLEKEAEKLGNKLQKLAEETGDKKIKDALGDIASSWKNFDPKDAEKAAKKAARQAEQLASSCA